MSQKYDLFVEETTPIFKDCANQWFPAGKTNEEGITYACSFCDLNYGTADKHDDDCILDLSKKILEEYKTIEADPKFTTDYKGVLRTSKESRELMNFFKARAALSLLLPHFSHFIIEPLTPGVCCVCNFYNEYLEKLEHHPNCPYKKIAVSLSKMFKVE